ncbi:MAG: tetratricopeptide repeat protein [Bacteroidia bacterium]|nr:tetratricopeptide repeat protein [Bacteroidia bacterium]
MQQPQYLDFSPILKLFRLKNKFLLYIIYLSIFSTQANTPQNLLDSARIYYSKVNYEKAIEIYNKIVSLDFESSAIYYNLGNAYFKSNKIPQAILNYERAKLLNPKDEDILFNLELANKYVVDKINVLPEIFFITWYRNFINMFPSDKWATASLIAFIAFLLLLSLYFYSGKIILKKLGFWFGVLFLAFSLIALFFAYKQKQFSETRNTAIVFSDSVTVKSSPDESGTDLFVIHAGLKVKVEDKVGDWVEIKLTDGNTGWVKEIDVEII